MSVPTSKFKCLSPSSRQNVETFTGFSFLGLRISSLFLFYIFKNVIFLQYGLLIQGTIQSHLLFEFFNWYFLQLFYIKAVLGTFILCWLCRNSVLLTVVKILTSSSICFGKEWKKCHLFAQYQFNHEHKILKLSKEKYPPASNCW